MNRRSVALVALLIALPVAARAGEVKCESKDDREAQCPIDTSGSVRIVRQLSDADCVEGRTWGLRRSSVWVRGGCRAIFASQAAQTLPTEVTCKSNDFRRNACAIDTSVGVRLERQLSEADCAQGRTWGVLGNAVWVSNGCEGKFVSERGGVSERGERGRPWGDLPTRVTCESENRTQVLCRLDAREGVRLVRRLSDAKCVEGDSWGTYRRFVWVSDGCRAIFESNGDRRYEPDRRYDERRYDERRYDDDPYRRR